MCNAVVRLTAAAAAVESGDLVALQRIVGDQPTVDDLLVPAVRRNHCQILSWLLEKRSSALSCGSKDELVQLPQSLLQAAVTNGCYHCVSELLQHGVSNNAPQDHSGLSALQLAVERSDRLLVERLSSHVYVGCDSCLGDYCSNVCKGFVTALLRNDPLMVQTLGDAAGLQHVLCPMSAYLCKEQLQAAGGLSSDMPPLIIEKLLETNACAVFVPAALGATDCLSVLAGSLPVETLLSCRDEEGWDLLMTAACAGHSDSVKWLCERGADVDIVSRIGRSPLWLAALSGHAECVQVLMDFGADFEQCEQAGFTPLLVAAAQGRLQCCQLMLNAGAQINVQNKSGMTALSLAACHGHLEVLELLIEKGAALDKSDRSGNTAIGLAAQAGHKAVVCVLLSKGATLSEPAARTLLTSPPFGPSLTCWEVLALLSTPAQVWAVTAVADFYSRQRGQPPVSQPCRNFVVELLLTAVSQMLDSFLYQLSPVDNSSLGRRPAFLLTLVGNGLCAGEMTHRWQQQLLMQWEKTVALFKVMESTDSLAAWAVPTPALVSRLGNLLTAFHDARRLMWPGQHETSLAEFVKDHNQLLSKLVLSRAAEGDLVAWHCLLEYQGVLPVAAKQLLLQSELRLAHGGSGSSKVVLEVPRLGALEALAEQFCSGQGLASASASLATGISIKFAGEAGVGDGLRREWFSIVAADALNLEYGLFASTDGGRTFHPSAESGVHDDHLQYFEMLGRIVGLAVLYGSPLPGAHFTRSFRKAMLGQQPDLADLAYMDPQMYSSLQAVLEGKVSAQDLCLNFTTNDTFGKQVELIPGGEDVEVTDASLLHYVRLLVQYKLIGSVSEQVEAFLKGWRYLIPLRVLDLMKRCLTPEELDVLICGADNVDVSAWREHTCYVNCTTASKQVRWFWSLVADMTAEEQAKLLGFATGSTAVPAGGFGSLLGFNGAPQPFTLHLVANECDGRLPRARTCFNTIYLPAYSCSRVLVQRVRQALSAVAIFDEGLWA